MPVRTHEVDAGQTRSASQVGWISGTIQRQVLVVTDRLKLHSHRNATRDNARRCTSTRVVNLWLTITTRMIQLLLLHG